LIGRRRRGLGIKSFPRIFKMGLFLGDSSCVKRVVCNIEKQGGEYGNKVVFVFLSWNMVGGFSMYLINFRLLKSP
jgi:hypothetical protein